MATERRGISRLMPAALLALSIAHADSLSVDHLLTAQLPPATALPQLGDSGHSMLSDSVGERGAWLRAKAAELPPPGRNTIIVTHGPNIVEAYPQGADGLADGEALILHPDGHGQAPILARVKIEEWAALADDSGDPK